MTNDLPHRIENLLEYGRMNAYSNIFAFSTTRKGGVSTGMYASMNCTPYTGDDADCVKRNQQRLCSMLPIPVSELVIPYQTHGTQVKVIDEAYLQRSEIQRRQELQETDAIITALPHICLCISTADCIPVLLYDHTHQVIAAIHAGWRGTVNGIVPHTLQQLHRLYGTEGHELTAAIGPGISLDSFEIGEEVYEAFQTAGFPMQRISVWKPVTGKHHIDLWTAIHLQLTDFGIPETQIETAGICTYQHHEDFFSARRLGIRSGRILTGIVRTSERK